MVQSCRLVSLSKAYRGDLWRRTMTGVTIVGECSRSFESECGLPRVAAGIGSTIRRPPAQGPVATSDSRRDSSSIAPCALSASPSRKHQRPTSTMASGRATSQTPVPTTETAESAGASSTVSAAEWEGMSSLLKNVYDYRDAESVPTVSCCIITHADVPAVATTPPNSSSARSTNARCPITTISSRSPWP
jgi:hypothetical protein